MGSNKDIVTSDYAKENKVSDEAANAFKLDSFLVRFLMHEPFFSTIIRSMDKVKTTRIPTAGVTAANGTLTLYWNPHFLAGLEPKQVFGLLKHECYHLIFKHCTARKQDPHLIWNFATDLAINSLIPENELPDGGLIPGKKLDTTKITDEEYLEKMKKFSDLVASFPKCQASEWYMKQLMEDENLQDMIKQNDNCNKCGGNHGDGTGQGQGSGECDGSGTSPGSGAGFPGFDDHEGWGEGLSDEERQIVEGQIQETIKEAARNADSRNAWGSVPSSVQKEIRAMIKKSVDWKRVLQSFVGKRQRANKSTTHRRINRKYPYIHPGKQRNYTSSLAIYIDQSGSVGDDEIALFFGALAELAKSVTFTVYHFDVGVDAKNKFVWRKGKKNIKPHRTRSGGTCFDSVEDHFRTVTGEFDGYLILTDGCAPKPKSTVSQRCWVILPNYDLYFTPDKKDTVVSMSLKG